MNRLRRGLLGTLLGAIIGFALVTLFYVGLALADGTRLGEAAGFGLVVGVAGGGMGGLIGLTVGVLRLGWLGGTLAGAAATVIAVVFYVVVFGDPAFLGHFLRESAVVLLVLGLPLTLTGALTAILLKRARPAPHGSAT